MTEAADKPIRFTRHAVLRMEQFDIATALVERTVRAPDWTEPDPAPPVQRRFLALPELQGRVLRVACIEEQDHIRILSAFPDRNARRPDAP